MHCSPSVHADLPMTTDSERETHPEALGMRVISLGLIFSLKKKKYPHTFHLKDVGGIKAMVLGQLRLERSAY